jgi:hypothetical protein
LGLNSLTRSSLRETLLPLTITRRLFLGLLLLVGLQLPAFAAVEIAFYSRELGGNNFPHAFVVIRGTVDSTGEQVDERLGFTASAISPAILWGSVRGEVFDEPERQIARSDRQFALTLSDEQYRAVRAVVERWRNAPQPSYNLNRANCVHFVGELARAAGLRVDFQERLMKRPRSFLIAVRDANTDLLAHPAGAAQPTTSAARPAS